MRRKASKGRLAKDVLESLCTLVDCRNCKEAQFSAAEIAKGVISSSYGRRIGAKEVPELLRRFADCVEERNGVFTVTDSERAYEFIDSVYRE